jgi:hypothetical protein
MMLKLSLYIKPSSLLISHIEQSLMKKRSSKHQNKKGIFNKRFHGWYILFMKTMKLLVNNKIQPYSSPQMFNNNLFLQPHHGNMVIV